MASPSPFLFVKQRIEYWGQSLVTEPIIKQQIYISMACQVLYLFSRRCG